MVPKRYISNHKFYIGRVALCHGLPVTEEEIKMGQKKINYECIKCHEVVASPCASAKRRACSKISYEALAQFIGLEPGSIMFVEKDPDRGILYMHHNDEKVGCFDLAEGQASPEIAIPSRLQQEAAAKLLRNHGWEVKRGEE